MSEYAEELWRCIRDASEKCRVQYAGLYSDTTPVESKEVTVGTVLLRQAIHHH